MGGSRKHRSGPNIPATFVPANVSAGMVANVGQDHLNSESDPAAPPDPPVSAEVFDYAEWK